MIRVGTCKYEGTKRIDPSYPGFTNIVVLMKSHSKWGNLGPYILKDEKGRIMENIWQFSKIYENTIATNQRYSRFDKTIIWSQNQETHAVVMENNNIENNTFTLKNKKYQTTAEYIIWRKRGKNNEYAVRYPNGYNGKKKVLTCLTKLPTTEWKSMSYIEARKAIYAPLYCYLASQQPEFLLLKSKLEKGENLLIIEVDGPGDLEYYKEKYNDISENLIENDTILITQPHIELMINDEHRPFGHGYCLACALLGKEEWCFSNDIISKYQQKILRRKYDYHGPYCLCFDGFVKINFS